MGWVEPLHVEPEYHKGMRCACAAHVGTRDSDRLGCGAPVLSR